MFRKTAEGNLSALYIVGLFAKPRTETQLPEPRRMMSSQKDKHPIYQRPRHPSDQLKVVLDYLDYLKYWDIDGLDKITTSDFTQQTFPDSLNIPKRSKKEDFEYLRSFRDSLNGAPLEVRDTQICFDLVSPS